MRQFIKFFANINILSGIILLFSPLLYIVIVSMPFQQNNISVSAAPLSTEEQTQIISQNPINPSSNLEQDFKNITTPLLSFDQDMGKIEISSIGLNTTIHEDKYSNEGLDKGVWRMPDYGVPDNKDLPTILAAHRWGPDSASNDYRAKNLFLNLPELENGDVINITWNSKLYQYKVVFKEEQNYVTRMADLILITCKFYHSQIRIIVYAQRI